MLQCFSYDLRLIIQQFDRYVLTTALMLITDDF